MAECRPILKCILLVVEQSTAGPPSVFWPENIQHWCEGCITTRGCSGGKGSDDTRNYGVGSDDVGKELPRVEPVNVCSLGRTCPEHLKKPVPGCIYLGIPLGSTIIVVRGTLHTSIIQQSYVVYK